VPYLLSIYLTIMKQSEGNGHFTFEGYKSICQCACTRVGDSSYVWTFIVICWNLMARCSSVISLNMQHMSSKNDSLVVIVTKLKGNQEGNHSYPKHVYACPTDIYHVNVYPYICPVLTLAVHIFSRWSSHRIQFYSFIS
jgi:hypothetical protein